MDQIREQLQKPLAAAIAGFIVGLLFGWIVIGWGIWPVEWTDATSAHLRADLKEDYMRMAIDSNTLHPDPTKAKERWDGLQPGAEDVLAAIQAAPGAQLNDLANFSVAVQPGAVVPEEAAAEDAEKGSNVTMLLVM